MGNLRPTVCDREVRGDPRGEFELFVDRARYRTEARRDPEYGCQASRTSYSRSNSGLRWDRPSFDQTDRHPVACVSIRDAIAYTRWLPQETSNSYRLPSAAEWQYAYRAGSPEAMLHRGGRRFFGHLSTPMSTIASVVMVLPWQLGDFPGSVQ